MIALVEFTQLIIFITLGLAILAAAIARSLS